MVNLAGPRPLGNSIESMDLGFTLQARCLEAVANGSVDATSCVVPVPAAIDDLVASTYVALVDGGRHFQLQQRSVERQRRLRDSLRERRDPRELAPGGGREEHLALAAHVDVELRFERVGDLAPAVRGRPAAANAAPRSVIS